MLFVDMLREGGWSVYLLLGAVSFGGLVAMVVMLMLALRQWVPSVLLFLSPAVALGIGIWGHGVGIQSAAMALGSVSVEQRDRLLLKALSLASIPEFLGGILVGALLIVQVLAMGVGNLLGKGEDADPTHLDAGLSLGICLFGAAGLVAWGVAQDMSFGLILGAALALGGLGCALGAVRLGSTEEDRSRHAAVRISQGVALGTGMALLGMGLYGLGVYKAQQSLLVVTPDLRMRYLVEGYVQARFALVAGGAGAVLGLLGGGITALRVLSDLPGRRTLFSAGATVLLLLPVTGGGIWAHEQRARLEALFDRSAFEEILVESQAPRSGDEDSALQAVTRSPSAVCMLHRQGDDWSLLSSLAEEVPQARCAPTRAERPQQEYLLALDASAPARWVTHESWRSRGSLQFVLMMEPSSPPSSMSGMPSFLRWSMSQQGLPLVWRRHKDLEVERPDDRLEPDALREVAESEALVWLHTERGWRSWHRDRGFSKAVSGARSEQSTMLTRWFGEGDQDPNGSLEVLIALRKGDTIQDLVDACAVVQHAARESDRGQAQCVIGDIDAEEWLARHPVDSRATSTQGDPGKEEPAGASSSLGKVVIQRVMRAHTRKAKYCYEKELVKNPKLAGEVTLEFTISAAGEVSTATVASSTFDKASSSKIERCLVRMAERMRFPRSGGVSKIRYPFVFHPSN